MVRVMFLACTVGRDGERISLFGDEMMRGWVRIVVDRF